MRHKHTAGSEAIAGMGRAAEATSRRIVAEVPPHEPTRSPPQVWQGGLGLRPRSGWAVLIEGARPGRRGGIQAAFLERSTGQLVRFSVESSSGIRSSRCHSVPLGATRSYLLDTLYLALTCTNGCSCWSPLEEIWPWFVVVSDALVPTELHARDGCCDWSGGCGAVSPASAQRGFLGLLIRISVGPASGVRVVRHSATCDTEAW
jgi:hypothetical protein